MIEIRFHGRGGQGAVTSAELLALGAIEEGKHAQAFPSFGPERRGAPVVAFCRINDDDIRIRAVIYRPDIVLVLDPSILRLVDVGNGLKEDGVLVANTRFSPEEIKKELGLKSRVATVDANHIAREEIGLTITNTTMLGALLKAAAVVDKGAMLEPFQERFGRLAQRNIKAFERAYKETKTS
jgi:pyruvate ferredoxin oxidoreductase gamma subunit